MSRSFGSETPKKPHLVRDGKGGVAGEVGDLRSDVNAGFTALEAELDAKNVVRLATDAALPACTAAGAGVGKTLTANANGALTVDAVTPVPIGTRVLVKDQAAGRDNGWYSVTNPGAAGAPWVLTRVTDADSSAQVMSGRWAYISEGAVNATATWVLVTVNPIVLDTTALVFATFPIGLHAATHEVGGADEISVLNLSGLLADPQTPLGHNATHILAGADEIDGDRLDVDMTPTHYAPDAGVPEAGNVDHLAAHLGGLDNEIGTINARTGYPEIHAIRPVAGPTLMANGAEDFSLLGADFLQAQTFASIAIGTLVITAEEPGVAGNLIEAEVVDSGGIGGTTVVYAGGVMTIDLDGVAPDEDAVAALINVQGDTWEGILRATSGGGGAVAVTAQAPLAGGAGGGLTAYIGGAACALVGQALGITNSDITASVQDALLTLRPPDLTAVAVPVLAAADTAAAWVEVEGLVTQSVSVVLA